MNYISFLFAITVITTTIAMHTMDTPKEMPQWFIDYKQTHHKKYSLLEEQTAFKLLQTRQHLIESLEPDGVTLSLHADSDRNMTAVNPHLAKPRRRWTEWYSNRLKSTPIPSSFDWRQHHYVTSPRRQGRCGGCYAFAAVEHLEFWYKKKTGKLKKLSVQQAMDCSAPESDGCDGGLMEDVYYHSYWNPIGPATFDEWTGKDGQCKVRRSHPHVRVHSYESMSSENNDPVEAHLAHNVYHYGPIPIAIDASSNVFENYHSGIVKEEHCGTEVDHAVLVVGYTPTYWIVKNSWGQSWGEDGYVRIERGKNACGIDTYASFATSVSV